MLARPTSSIVPTRHIDTIPRIATTKHIATIRRPAGRDGG
jgi:hypothetical protein